MESLVVVVTVYKQMWQEDESSNRLREESLMLITEDSRGEGRVWERDSGKQSQLRMKKIWHCLIWWLVHFEAEAHRDRISIPRRKSWPHLVLLCYEQIFTQIQAKNNSLRPTVALFCFYDERGHSQWSISLSIHECIPSVNTEWAEPFSTA